MKIILSAADDIAFVLGGIGKNGVGTRFWSSLRAGRLELPWCRACSRPFFYPRVMCPRCWSLDLDWQPSSGRGMVYAITEVKVPFQGLMPEQLPLRIALIDLDDGVRIPGQVEIAGSVTNGDRVRIAAAPTPQSGPLVFRKDSGDDRGQP